LLAIAQRGVKDTDMVGHGAACVEWGVGVPQASLAQAPCGRAKSTRLRARKSKQQKAVPMHDRTNTAQIARKSSRL
jgi:hypothetical protein